MDWQTSGDHALGALSETEMAKTRIHNGDNISGLCYSFDY